MRSIPAIKIKTFIAYVIITIASLFSIFPVYWMFATSLKTRWDSWRLPPKWIFKPTFENYISVFGGKGWSTTPMVILMKHSLILSVAATILALISGALAAYSIARFNVRGRKQFAKTIFSTRIFPPVVVALPIFAMIQGINLVDTYQGLIIIYTAMNVPFVVWMLKGFFQTIPEDLEKSAMIDGCSRFKAFRVITFPLVLPGLAATSIFVWTNCWNEFLFSLLLTRSLKTAPVSVTEFVTLYGIQWGQLTATASLMVLPALILVLFVQKYLVQGLTFGAVR